MTPEPSPNALVRKLFALGGGRGVPPMLGGFRLVADADTASVVFRNPDVFVKDYGALDLLGHSRLHVDGEEWRARRALTQAGINAASMQKDRIAAAFGSAVGRIAAEAASEEVDPEVLGQAVIHTTVRILLMALEAEHDPVEMVSSLATLRGLARDLQTASLCSSQKVDMAKLVAEIAAFRAKLRLHAEAVPAFQSLLDRMAERYKGGAVPFHAVDEFTTNLFAGAETSAVVLGWAMLMLGAYPVIQEELRSESATGASEGIERFLNETMRLLPPVPLVTRKLGEGFSAEGFKGEAGELVLVSVVGVHLDPAQWRSPRLFYPARPKYADRGALKHALVPFLHGPRACGGAALARIELVEGMHALLRNFRFRRTETPLAFNYALAMAPVLKNRLVVERLA